MSRYFDKNHDMNRKAAIAPCSNVPVFLFRGRTKSAALS